jgi:hypothetical protein
MDEVRGGETGPATDAELDEEQQRHDDRKRTCVARSSKKRDGDTVIMGALQERDGEERKPDECGGQEGAQQHVAVAPRSSVPLA